MRTARQTDILILKAKRNAKLKYQKYLEDKMGERGEAWQGNEGTPLERETPSPVLPNGMV
jgi:hypothetical protein